jgi:signal transduction histidine kinase
LTSRLEAGQVDPQLAPIDVVDAVHRAVEDLGPTTSPIAVEAAEPVFVTADADHVQHILMNYLTNATKYGRPPVGVSVGRADGRAEVRVGDAGAGIPAELRADLFERFSPVRRALNPLAPGTGLGLWIVRGLARAQGGDAWYEHTASGPEFCVWLPLADGPPA